MPNFDKKPDGMPYAQWLKGKGVSFKITEAMHTDTNTPMSVHNYLKNKPNEVFDMALAKQGKALDPEDIGGE